MVYGAMSTHTCHNPNCNKPLPARYVVHAKAWYQLPRAMRLRIWALYRPGQETDKQPSYEYVLELEAAVKYMRDHNIKCE